MSITRNKLIAMFCCLSIFNADLMMGRAVRGGRRGSEHRRSRRSGEKLHKRGMSQDQKVDKDKLGRDWERFQDKKNNDFKEYEQKVTREMIYDNFLEDLEDPDLSEDDRRIIDKWMTNHEERKRLQEGESHEFTDEEIAAADAAEEADEKIMKIANSRVDTRRRRGASARGERRESSSRGGRSARGGRSQVRSMASEREDKPTRSSNRVGRSTSTQNSAPRRGVSRNRSSKNDLDKKEARKMAKKIVKIDKENARRMKEWEDKGNDPIVWG